MKSDKELASIPRWEERMRFVGRFIAYCLWTGETADLPMLPSVWALLLDKHLHQKDLMLDRPAVCECSRHPLLRPRLTLVLRMLRRQELQ